MYREALRLLLEGDTGFRVVGDSEDCRSAAPAVRRCRPDILLLDLPTAVLPDHRAVHTLTTLFPSSRLMVLAPDFERATITEALLFGVRGVVLKSVPVEILFRSIRAVVSGQYWVGREVVADLVQGLRAYGADPPAPRRASVGLTAREREIVSVLIRGWANKEIARHCSISERTVKHHLTNILHKLGLTSRLELAVFALQHPSLVSELSDRTVPPLVQ